jgi:hypothetical protein
LQGSSGSVVILVGAAMPPEAATAAHRHLPAFIKVGSSNLVDAVRDVGKTLAFLFHVLFILVDIDHQYQLSTLPFDLYHLYISCAVPSPPVYHLCNFSWLL